MGAGVEIVDALLASPTTRVVMITNGVGEPAVCRAREGAPGAALAVGADIAAAALAHFATAQGYGGVKVSFLLCQEATVVLGSLRDGRALAVVAEATSNLGLLLNACKKALADYEGDGGCDAGG